MTLIPELKLLNQSKKWAKVLERGRIEEKRGKLKNLDNKSKKSK